MSVVRSMFSPKLWVGAAAGYVLGARAGREQYDKIMLKVTSTKQRASAQAREASADVLDKVKDTGAEALDKMKDHAHASG